MEVGDLLPKLKLEIFVPNKDADTVMEIICNAARTGKFGDGRIFVSPVEKSGKVRTGELDINDSEVIAMGKTLEGLASSSALKA